jgi:hypothetical protein
MGYSILPEIKLLYRFKMEKRLLLFRATSTSHLILSSNLAFANYTWGLDMEDLKYLPDIYD